MAENSNRANLTKPFIKALKPDAGKETFIWDTHERGLGVRVRPSGIKTWVFQYRLNNRPLRYTIGKAEAIHTDTARKMAVKFRAMVVEGKDPAAEKTAARTAKTVAELCDDYLKWLEKRTQKPVKPSTLYMERGRIEAHVKPLLGRRMVKSLDVDVIEQFFQDVADGKTASPEPPKGEKRKRGGVTRGGVAAAHRNTEMLGSILQFAIAKKIILVNPVHLFKRSKEKTLKPPFSVQAVTKVGTAMRELEAEGEPAVGIRVARHLLLTGFRRMEALTLKWGKVDAPAHCARLEDTKTGPQIRPLGQAALDHLASFRPKEARPGDYVFPGSGEAGHYVGAPKAWERIAKRAGIEGVSLHGLRHWFASTGAELGYSDIVIGAIIGHAKQGITGRYATAPDAVLMAASTRIAQRLADALDGIGAGNVIKIPRAR